MAEVGISQAMRQRWLAVDKAPAKAPGDGPAADGDAGKKEKKSSKGDNDRIIRKVRRFICWNRTHGHSPQGFGLG